MTRWNGTVVLAGRPFALFVRPDEASWPPTRNYRR